jgi:mannose-1-phosphate guanylyltransferase
MNNNNYAVIMAGGIGSRFWPMSRSTYPKQFLDILGTGETLIQQTFRRLAKSCPTENILVVTNTKYKSLCLEQLNDILEDNILCEPTMRNTAPCIAYASFKINKKNPNANIIVAPSDHLISNEEEFTKIISECFEVCTNNDVLLTLGIKPSRPDTGYGYIQFNEEKSELHNNIHNVKTFTEKPNLELANQFLDSGDFLWNSGIFIWSAKAVTLGLRKYLRDLYDRFEDGNAYYNTDEEVEFINRIFPGCKSISIDYGLMEKADNVFVYPSDFGWSDLGTWGSLYGHLQLDDNQNGVIGYNVMLYDSKKNIVNTPNDKVVVVQGLEDYIIIDNKNTLLICKKEDEQQIKQFVSDIKREKGEDYV